MLFSRLAEYFERIDATSLRNAKTEILAEIFKESTEEEIDKLTYLALGGLRPKFDRLEFDMGEALILRAIGASAKEYQEIGDLGELVYQQLSKSVGQYVSESVRMSVIDVYAELTKIASDAGTGSQDRKVERLAKLLKSTSSVGAKYIVRMVSGKLRLGFSDKTIIDALSYLECGTKEFSDSLESAYQMRPDVGYLAKLVKAVGVMKAVASVEISIGTPVVPALAQRLKTAKEMIDKMGRVYVEPKMDGTRVQIHFSANQQIGKSANQKELQSANQQIGKSANQKEFQNSNNQTGLFGDEDQIPKFWVRTFTRNLDESSAMFPELQSIASQIKAEEVILDCEAVGYDPKTGKLLPFQMTITRKRKHGVSDAQASVPLKFFIFDILYLDGKSMIQLPLRERRRILGETIVGVDARDALVVDDFIETDDPDVLRRYHKQQLADGLEGALVKQIDGKYVPGRAGYNWVKFKEAEDSRAKLSDTIDVVIMGYYLGKGKRQKFGVGAFLVGIRGNNQAPNSNNQTNSNNPNHKIENSDMILTVAKVGTGISDEQFGELRERLEKIKKINRNMEYMVPKILEPDVWVEPRIVVEVAADEISSSPTHSAGYALRFPRMVKFRDDKSVEEITTLGEILAMYEMQNQ